MFRRALVSVSDKTGLVEFLKPMCSEGLKVVSTGGTAQYLREHGIEVQDVSELTHFPEVMNGRVKTLHPNIHMGLLARNNHKEDALVLEKNGVDIFDLVIVNLYPFEQSLRAELSEPDMVEKIDIGGPSMLRSAAKNFERITVVCDPKDYPLLNSRTSDLELRKKLASKVFMHTSLYDGLISGYLNPSYEDEISIGARKIQELRYGENPHQKATWYKTINLQTGIESFKILQGKELSYNNLLDIEAAFELSQSLPEINAVAVKHNNPCGVVYDETNQIVNKLISTDPVSIFGGIVATNRTVDAEMATSLSQIFLECIVAPDFSGAAIEIFQKKKNVRLLSFGKNKMSIKKSMRPILGGLLVQDKDLQYMNSSSWIFHREKPTLGVLKDLLFGEIVCGFLKSNAIAIVENQMTLGLGMGQVNRIDAIEHSIGRALKHHTITPNTVLISDAFFPFQDSIELIASKGIKWVLQPGGSIKDQDIINRAQELGINLIFSGKRHFRH